MTKKFFVTAAMLFAATTVASAQTFESQASQFQSRENDEQSIGSLYRDMQPRFDARTRVQVQHNQRQQRARNDYGMSVGESRY